MEVFQCHQLFVKSQNIFYVLNGYVLHSKWLSHFLTKIIGNILKSATISKIHWLLTKTDGVNVFVNDISNEVSTNCETKMFNFSNIKLIQFHLTLPKICRYSQKYLAPYLIIFWIQTAVKTYKNIKIWLILAKKLNILLLINFKYTTRRLLKIILEKKALYWFQSIVNLNVSTQYLGDYGM